MSEENILYEENQTFLLPQKTIKHYCLNRPLDSLLYNKYSEKENYIL